MKITTYISLLFIAVTLSTSCKKDDDTPKKADTADNTLPGVWQLEQLFIVNVDAQIDDCRKKSTYNIKADNKFASVDYELKDSVCTKSETTGTWKTEGNKLHIDDGKDKLTFTYSIKDGKLTLEGERNSVSYKFVFKKT